MGERQVYWYRADGSLGLFQHTMSNGSWPSVVMESRLLRTYYWVQQSAERFPTTQLANCVHRCSNRVRSSKQELINSYLVDQEGAVEQLACYYNNG